MSQSDRRVRCGVEWYMPDTMIGDGGPFRGTLFVDAISAIQAFAGVEDGDLLPRWWERDPGDVVVTRAYVVGAYVTRGSRG